MAAELIAATRGLSDAQAAALEQALVTHQVLFFENQPLTPAEQKAFAARFGDLHIHPVYPNVPEQPEIMVLDTGAHNPTDNDVWHTDVTCIETPPAIVALPGKLLPPHGGDTVWASNIAAYNALSEPLRALLDPLKARHDFTRSFPEWRHNGDPEFTVRWKWKADDLVIWDNRSTQHYAVNDYLPHRRVMHRATVLGERPY